MNNILNTRLKASVLYIVIILSLVIAVICSSMIVSAYFYKSQYLQKSRFDGLQNNLESATSIILASDSNAYKQEEILSLYNNEDDSISLKIIPWGLFDIGQIKAFKQQDTLFRSFSVGYSVDSSKWSALYLTDGSRPLMLSGKTSIKGNAYLPRAGVFDTYVEGKEYEGDKRFIIGTRRNSKSTLPALSTERLKYLENSLKKKQGTDSVFGSNLIKVGFNQARKNCFFRRQLLDLKDVKLLGNIVLYADNQVYIDSSATLDNVVIFARSIRIGNGFKGRCQLFARDSIITGVNCHFQYPSCLAVLNFGSKENIQPRISLDSGTVFNGILLSWQRQKTDGQTLIHIGKDALIKGQVFAKGIVRFKERAKIEGSLSANQLMHEVNSTLYENYLIDTHIDAGALSPYYVSSSLFWVASGKRKVLQWLE